MQWNNIFKKFLRPRGYISLIILCIALIVGFVGNGNHHFSQNKIASGAISNSPLNFTQAKELARQIYADHRTTFYCGCHYDKHNQIDLHSCGYKIQYDKRRAKRVEWEHIMPVSLWGKEFPCWKNAICCKGKSAKYGKSCYKGRQCCREVDQEFSKIEADLHNLVPEIGELNALRSNFRFAVLPQKKPGQLGVCEMKIDSETRRVEPIPTTRGFIARIYLYMSETYKIPLSDSQRQLMNAWNKMYPPDEWEIERDNRIARLQGNHNPFVKDYNSRHE